MLVILDESFSSHSNGAALLFSYPVIFKGYRKEVTMIIDDVLNIYRKVRVIPSQCHLNWLKDNFNPILKELDSNLIPNWGCSTCVNNYMNMLLGWQDRKIKAKQQKPKPKPKRKKTYAKRKTTKRS